MGLGSQSRVSGDERDVYLVLDDFGRPGHVWVAAEYERLTLRGEGMVATKRHSSMRRRLRNLHVERDNTYPANIRPAGAAFIAMCGSRHASRASGAWSKTVR
jgi:hypothetical protein